MPEKNSGALLLLEGQYTMIGNLQFYRGTGTNPYDNLAVESYFLQHCPPETCIFYLWQNQRTVVIGKNQNAWQECNVSY